MKTSTCVIFVFLFLLGTLSYAQSKKELRKVKSDTEFAAIQQLIETRDFVFTAEYVNSSLVGQKSLFTPPNTVKLQHDSIFCDLPFFGRAYNVTHFDQGGISFAGAISDTHVKINNRKKQITLKMKSRKPGDWFQLTFIIHENGNSSLIVSSQNRESISYWGKIKALAEKN